MKYILTFLWLGVFTLFLCSLCFGEPRERVTVKNLVDGDTLQVFYHGKKGLLRFIGIDAPEIYENEKTERDIKSTHKSEKRIFSEGHQSLEYLRGVVHPGQSLEVEFGLGKRDKFQRLLAYVYLKDGTLLNEKLLRDGYVRLYIVKPDVKYASRFRSIYQEAREAHRGLWAHSISKPVKNKDKRAL